MRVEGVILPAGATSRVTFDAWCRLVAQRPEFRRPQPRRVINPFTQGPWLTRPRPDVAYVVVDGVTVGDVNWSMSEDDPLVNVSIERTALPLVMQWAAELGGEFREDELGETND